MGSWESNVLSGFYSDTLPESADFDSEPSDCYEDDVDWDADDDN